MNKKIILLGTIIGIMACLFPPFGIVLNGNLIHYEGLRFLFPVAWMNEKVVYEVIWNHLCVELLLITITTFGFAYYFASKKK